VVVVEAAVHQAVAAVVAVAGAGNNLIFFYSGHKNQAVDIPYRKEIF
jgi:hypothetical protein